MSSFNTSKSRAAFGPIPPQEERHSSTSELTEEEVDDFGVVFEDLGKTGKLGRTFFCILIVASAALIFVVQ